MRDERIILGTEAKDRITGLTGIVIAVTDWLNDCKRVSIQPRDLKDGKPIESQTFDAEQLEYVGSGLVASAPAVKKGGDRPNVSRAADPR